jgi:cytochrome c551/c552
MGFIEEITILPPPQHLPLLGYVLVATLLVHVPYMCLLFGCTALSLLFNHVGHFRGDESYSRFARDIVDAIAGRVALGMALGFLPQIVLIFTLAQLLFQRQIFRPEIHMVVPALVLLGLLFAFAYRSALIGNKRFEPTMLLGTAATGLIALGFLVFYGGMGVILNPDSWTVPRAPVEFIVASSVTPDFLRFMTLSIGLAGGWTLFLFFGWPEPCRLEGEGYRRFVRTIGLILVGCFIAAQPLFTLWHGLAMHPASVTPPSLALMAFTIVIIIFTGLLLWTLRTRAESTAALLVFPLLLLTYFAAAVDAHVLRGRATVEHRAIVTAEGQRVRNELMARLDELGDAASPERGKRVFEGRCMACHRFGGRLVGPPLETVLPKYAGRPEDLQAFVDYPVKVDPDYPSMPRLGLRRTEIEAVVNYVLQRFEEEYRAE